MYMISLTFCITLLIYFIAENEPNFYKMTPVPLHRPTRNHERHTSSGAMSLRSLLGSGTLNRPPSAPAPMPPLRRDLDAGPELISTNYSYLQNARLDPSNSGPSVDRWAAFTSGTPSGDSTDGYYPQDDPYDPAETDYLRSLMEPILDGSIFS